jgi:carbamoyl-phosphate synthase large subunit
VHAAYAIREAGFESIMVNCNPETVSTDYDTSEQALFRAADGRGRARIYEKEKPEGVIVQFGGQTPLNIARELAEAGVRILGTTVGRHRPGRGPRPLSGRSCAGWASRMPESGMAGNPRPRPWRSPDGIGYPLMVRPSYVLGGRGMEVVHDEEMLRAT